MTDSIWQTIATTPWWTLPLAAYVLRVSYLSTKPRTIPLKYFFYMPVCFLMLSAIYLTIVFFGHHQLYYAAWLDGMVLGLGIGYLQLKRNPIKVNKETATLLMPGSWMLVIILAISGTAKVLGFQFTTPLQDPSHPLFLIFFTFVFGLFTGLFIGRLISAKQLIQTGPYC